MPKEKPSQRLNRRLERLLTKRKHKQKHARVTAVSDSNILPRYYGAVDGVEANWIFDSGASVSFVSAGFVQRAGLSPLRCSTLSVGHSDGRTELVRTMVPGATLRMASAWSAPIDLYVLKELPDNMDMIIGNSWMAAHSADIRVREDGHTVSLTLGHKRVVLEPGPSEVYNEAEIAGLEVVRDLSACEDTGAEVYSLVCRWDGLEITDQHEAQVTTISVDPPEDWRRLRLQNMRREEPYILDDTMKKGLDQLVDQYRDSVYAENSYDNRMTHSGAVHRIPFADGTKLPREGPVIRQSAEKLQALTEICTKLLNKGYVNPSNSSVSSPAFLVSKPNGGWRLVIDYRAINAITSPDQYTPPIANELYQHTRGAKVYSRVDALDGFWGVQVDPGDRWKTAMRTPVPGMQLLEWNVMPMGLRSSPATFQRVMDDILREYIGKFVLVYVDDILIYSRNQEEHLEHLRLVHEKLAKAGVHLKESKCAYFLKSVRFLGNVVDEEGLHPDVTKIETLLDFPTPREKKDVRSLMGVIQFLRQFIPHVATWCKPLTDLTKSGVPFVWGEAQQTALDTVIRKLVESPVLVLSDPSREKAIMTDASDYATGGVLLQNEGTTDQPRWHPVAFHSRQMTNYESRQSPTEREFTAIVRAVEKWQHEIGGQKKLIIFSDHRPLSYYRTQPQLRAQVMRRLDLLESLNVAIEYKPADEVGIADWLSRSPEHRDQARRVEERRLQDGEPAHPMLATLAMVSAHHPGVRAAIQAAYATDPTYIAVMKSKNDQNIVHPEWDNKWRVHGDLLWYIERGYMQLYIPEAATLGEKSLRTVLLMEAHDSAIGGHQGEARTLERLRRWAHWPSISGSVRNHCRTCPQCQQNKPSPHSRQGLHWPLPVPARKWAMVSLDPVTGLTKSSTGFDSVLVIVDMLTKRHRFIPCTKNLSSADAALIYYNEIFKHHGLPMTLVSDAGPQFTSELWEKLWELTGTRLNRASTGHPNTDGQAERGIQSLEYMLRAFVNARGDDWDTYLPSLEFAFNDSIHRGTGFSPFFLEFGQDPMTPLSLTLGSIADSQESLQSNVDSFVTKLRESVQQARDALQQYKDHTAERLNKSRRDRPFRVGDRVWLKTESQARGNKLQPLFEGPYRILQIPSPNTVKLDMPGSRRVVFNVDRLRPHYQRHDPDLNVSDLRYHEAHDGCVELQYRVGGIWQALSSELIHSVGWSRLDDFHATCDQPPHSTLVGAKVQAWFKPMTTRARGRTRPRTAFFGRVALFDPDDKMYQVFFSDGDGDVYTRTELTKILTVPLGETVTALPVRASQMVLNSPPPNTVYIPSDEYPDAWEFPGANGSDSDIVDDYSP